jgi:hypothetical protein
MNLGLAITELDQFPLVFGPNSCSVMFNTYLASSIPGPGLHRSHHGILSPGGGVTQVGGSANTAVASAHDTSQRQRVEPIRNTDTSKRTQDTFSVVPPRPVE